MTEDSTVVEGLGNIIKEFDKRQTDAQKAIQLFEQSLSMKKSFYGETHPSVAATLNALAQAWSDLGDNKKALQLFEQSLSMKKSFYGETHPSVAITLHSMGMVFLDLGEGERAIELFKKSLQISKVFYDDDHPDVQVIRSVLESCKEV